MRGSDEIMAEYLLKGAKMLGKSCPECGSPLFTVKGETYCVVCRENKAQSAKETGGADGATGTKAAKSNKGTKSAKDSKVMKETANSEACVNAAEKEAEADTEFVTESDACSCGELRSEVEAAVKILCRRIKSETRPEDCVALMEAVSIGVDVLKKLE